jgi:EAL domain-containing protein (putative c-di-GMP-specific phosphodiesterase class I)
VHELLNLGCDRAQGYLLCRPKPASGLADILGRGGLDPLTFTTCQKAAPDAMMGGPATGSAETESRGQPAPLESVQLVSQARQQDRPEVGVG